MGRARNVRADGLPSTACPGLVVGRTENPVNKKGLVDCRHGRCYLGPMETCRCEAIVLGVSDYREADRLVSLFSLERGKIRGVARGAKRSVRRFGGALELFARLLLEITPSEGLARLLSADVVSIFAGIRTDLMKIALAGCAIELIDSLAPENMPYPRLFRLLATYLERLDTAPASPSDRRFFEVNLLNILGYRPPLEECADCGVALAGRTRLYVDGTGVLTCDRCGRGGRPVAPATVAFLQQALVTGRFGALSLSPDQLAEAALVLDPRLSVHLSRPLRSLAFLREIEG